MIMIPIESKDHEHDALIIVLDKDNLSRMQQADPPEIELRRCGKTLINPAICVCYQDPSPEWNRIVQGGNLAGMIEYLQRGWKFRPEQGDHDRGPESVKGKN